MSEISLIITPYKDDFVHDISVKCYMVESETTGNGRALLVWRNEDGHWRIFRDVY